MVNKLVELLKENNLTIATAESCTGGLLASKITSVPGSSGVFQYGFVTYSEEAKKKLIGVRDETFRKHSVYSAEVAKEMAIGAMEQSGAALGIGITGVAGENDEVVCVDGVKTLVESGTAYICCSRMTDNGLIHILSQELYANPDLVLCSNLRERRRNEISEYAICLAIEMIKEYIYDTKSRRKNETV